MNLGKLGTGGLFVAIIVGLCSVAISKFVIDHDWTIKLPDAVPEGIANSFNAIIPMGVNIIVWYGISLIISAVSGGTLTLASTGPGGTTFRILLPCTPEDAQPD